MSKLCVAELSDIYDFEEKENKLIQKTAVIIAKAAIKSMKTALQSWREYYSGRIVQKQQIIDQYSGCCSFLKRSPFLKTHLRRFLMCPSSDRLDLSGCGISSKDMAALICAMSGRGCDLKEDRVTSIQLVRGILGDENMSSMDFSSNNLGADGTITFINILMQADFFRFERSISSVECVGLHSALTDLDLSRNSIGIAGSAAIESLLAAPKCTIKNLVLCCNMLADPGCAMVFRALKHNRSLTSLNMSENGAANAAGYQMGAALEANTALSHLNLAYNHLRGDGARRIGYGLGSNTTMKKLELQWNGFGDEDTMAELAKAIPQCALTELNLAHNRIKLKGATILSSFLEGGCCVKELVLDGNLIGQIGARMLFRAVQEASTRGQEFRTAVRTVNCGTHMVDRGAFDPCETAGDYALDLGDAYNRTVLCNLIRTSITGSGSFLSIKAGGKPTLFNATLGGMPVKISNNGSIDTGDWTVCTAAGLNLPISEQRDSDGQPVPLVKTWARLLNRPEDATSCTLTFAFKSDRKRATAGDALSARNMEILVGVFSDPGSSSEKCIETIDIIFGADTFVSMEQAELLLDLLTSTDPSRHAKLSAARITFVARCFHKIVETERNAGIIDRLTSIEERKALQKALGSVSRAMPCCCCCLQTLTCVTCFCCCCCCCCCRYRRHRRRSSPASSLLLRFCCCRRRLCRCCCGSCACPTLNRIARSDTLRDVGMAGMAGQVSFEYTPNNPTGHHKLDLSEPAQRDICLRLLEIKNEMQAREEQLRSFYSSGKRAGGRREDACDAAELERVWRNGRLDGAALPYREGWKVPRSGTLEVDFVCVAKPGMRDMPAPRPDCTPELAFQRLLESLRADGIDEPGRVAVLRRHSNTDLFTCRQLATLLALFDQSDMRVEVCVIAFARTVDWHGFRTVIQALRPRELKLLFARVGFINLFDDVMAVDFYELDLDNASERFVLQERLHARDPFGFPWS
jgi:Ran GTPase-activating protein (RanGAP) involved in mRNA processing and transport